MNINISIKEEAYKFLSSLKNNKKSFSDVILEFKEKGNKKKLTKYYGILKDINWTEREKSMKEFRASFNDEMNKTIEEMEKARK